MVFLAKNWNIPVLCIFKWIQRNTGRLVDNEILVIYAYYSTGCNNYIIRFSVTSVSCSVIRFYVV
jgi:hypothetical protein